MDDCTLNSKQAQSLAQTVITKISNNGIKRKTLLRQIILNQYLISPPSSPDTEP